MKIFQFIYSLESGGAERFVVDLTNELSENNEVFLYVLRDDRIKNLSFYKPEIINKVIYKNLRIKPGFNPLLIWTFYKLIKSEKPDVVHCHLNLVNYFFFLSLLFQRKIRFIYTMHSSAKAEVSSGLERSIRRFFFKHSFFVPVAISHGTKESYEKFYDLKNIEIIYHGRKFSGRSERYEDVKDEILKLKPTPDTLVFCHVARYDEQKNQRMLIRIFNKLKQDGCDIILLIIGNGFEKVPEIKAQAGDHIYFLGIKSNVYDYLFVSDAFCLSSVNEGMPISLIEAFACGCVPICTPVGGIVNIIENGRTGFLSKSVSDSDYYDAVMQFIRNRELVNRNNLTNYFLDNLSIKQCADKYLKLYNS